MPDAAGAAAVDLAREAAVEVAGVSQVGEHLGAEADGERIVTHYFDNLSPAYVGWRWAVTVVRAARAKAVTVDEVVLLPGAGALVSPEWLPWSERLQPGDLGVGDVLGTAADDPRLEPGYASIDDPEGRQVAFELGLGRVRVLSVLGRDDAVDRWYSGERGPDAPIAKAAPHQCSTCGFLVAMGGALSRMFGVCANEMAPDDGQVVSYDHGCGAHSEALVITHEPTPTPLSDLVDASAEDGADAVESPAIVDAEPPATLETVRAARDARRGRAARGPRRRAGTQLNDVFGTAALRARVLDAWTASPARFREDANAEEDLFLGGYRDRLLVELAQNAADAAAGAAVPGRLRLTLSMDSSNRPVLRAQNTGVPLDVAGVEALSTLRASAKRDGAAVGRFGVGFAAVLAVSDDPVVASTSGAVRWSRQQARELVAGVPSLRGELARRGDAVPVLRLPFAAAEVPPSGFATEVVLPLRDDVAEQLVRRLLAEVDAALLLALPGLERVEIVVDGAERVLESHRDGEDLVIDGVRWRIARGRGRLTPELLVGRGVEERERTTWSSTWAVPVSTDGVPQPLPAGMPSVVHAPTPTDEPLSLPALLIASLPLDPTRRHVAAGPLRDFVLEQAAALFGDLVRTLPADVGVLSLVPTGLAAGELDAVLRRALLPVLSATPFLPPAAREAETEILIAPRDAVVVDDERLVDVLAPVLPGLLPAGWARALGALTALGVRRMSVADVVEALPGLDREPSWWHGLYEALEGHDRDTLGALPVPLADGQMAPSPRGLLMPGGTALGALGFREVHPAAAHPLLLRLGAVQPEPDVLLGDARVRAAVAASFDDWCDGGDPAPVAEAVLALVAAAGISPGRDQGLAELALPAGDGEVYPAGELLLPSSPLVGLMVDDAPFGVVDDALVERWGAGVLEAVGVLRTFSVARAEHVGAAECDLDGEQEYLDVVTSLLHGGDEPAVVVELVGVRDLELVRPNQWPAALRLLADAPLRDAVVTPAQVVRGGSGLQVPSYTSWWLRRHRVVAGRLPGGDPLLVGLFDAVDSDLDPALLRAAGALVDLDDADPDEVLAAMADPARTLDREQVRAIYARLDPVEPPRAVRAVRGGALVVVPADEAVVVDAPDLLPLLGGRAVVPASAADAVHVADALDLPLASELAAFTVHSAGTDRGDHVEHERLEVAGVDGRLVNVPWRLVDGVLHVDRERAAFGLGRGRAWRDGQWHRRYLLTAALADPASLDVLLAEEDLDAWPSGGPADG